MTELDKLLKDNLSKETYEKAVITNKDKHTPAPWKINHHGEKYIISTDLDGNDVIAKVEDHAPTMDDMEKEAQANAHLIAAAPELLEALEMASNIINSEARDSKYGNAKEKINKAIAKAKNNK